MVVLEELPTPAILTDHAGQRVKARRREGPRGAVELYREAGIALPRAVVRDVAILETPSFSSGAVKHN